VIVLDTNVISEPLRVAGEPRVRAWLNEQSPETLYTTALNIAELLAGVALLPAGKRKRELDRRLRASLSRLFQGRILLFDLAAAESYAQIAGEARRAGRTVPHEDGLIAAIARAHGFAVATRNVSNFAGAGVELINPWDLS
jgi:predicted nucleic acid-binding protein